MGQTSKTITQTLTVINYDGDFTKYVSIPVLNPSHPEFVSNLHKLIEQGSKNT